MTLKTYIIYQDTNTDFESYQYAVVIAENTNDAKHWHPRGERIEENYTNEDGTWVPLNEVRCLPISSPCLMEGEQTGVKFAYYFGGQD